MQTAREFLEELNDPEIFRMYDLWLAARAANRFPSQRDIDLPTVPKLLPKLYILDRVGDTFRYRFMGTEIDKHVGMSLTGKLFTDVRSGAQTAQITQFFHDVLDNGCMGLPTTRLPVKLKNWHVYRRLAFPIADDHETPNKVTGLFLMERFDDLSDRRRSVLDGENAADGVVISQFAKLYLKFSEFFGRLVRSRRLELPPLLQDSDLNAARLPVPPRPHWGVELSGRLHVVKPRYSLRFRGLRQSLSPPITAL